MARVNFVEALGPGVVVLNYNGDSAVWGHTKARKRTTCGVTNKPINPGDEIYRPIGNQQYRYVRILASVVEAALIQENA